MSVGPTPQGRRVCRCTVEPGRERTDDECNLSSFLGSRRAHEEADVASPGRKGLSCPFCKVKPRHQMQAETDSPRKMSKSAHFITYSIAERPRGKGSCTDAPLSPLCFLPLKQLNPTLLGYEATRQRGEDWYLETGKPKKQKALLLL